MAVGTQTNVQTSTDTQTNAEPLANADTRSGIDAHSVGTHGDDITSYDTHRNAPIKVYTDVSVRNGQTGIGMVVKNHNGKILHRKWYVINGEYEAMEAEALAVRKAMFDIHADHAKFYTDCDEAGKLFTTDVSLPVRKFEYVTLNCVDRDENFDAHILARKANPHTDV